MKYFWVPNIQCDIKDGKLFLSQEYKSRLSCSGECHSCISFLGVDLADTGNEHYKSCCAMNQIGSVDPGKPLARMRT